MKYEVKKVQLMDEVCAEIYRDGKRICSTTWLGETDAELIEIAKAHAAERGL